MSLSYSSALVRAAVAAAIALAPAISQAKETITLCFERQEVLPWRTLTHKGLNFVMLEKVAARLDVQFDYQSMPWKRCLEQLKNNHVGGAFAVSFSRDRLKVGAYPGGVNPDASKRMHVDRYVLVRRKGARINWDGKSFTGVDGAIGIQLGYSVGDFLHSHNVQIDEGSQRSTELAQKLVAGRLNAAAMGGGDAAAMMRGPMAAKLEVLPVPLIEKPYFLILSQALVQSNPELANRIWKTIEEVRNSPAYRKLERESEGVHH